jgi:hypothetical protein
MEFSKTHLETSGFRIKTMSSPAAQFAKSLERQFIVWTSRMGFPNRRAAAGHSLKTVPETCGLVRIGMFSDGVLGHHRRFAQPDWETRTD